MTEHQAFLQQPKSISCCFFDSFAAFKSQLTFDRLKRSFEKIYKYLRRHVHSFNRNDSCKYWLKQCAQIRKFFATWTFLRIYKAICKILNLLWQCLVSYKAKVHC